MKICVHEQSTYFFLPMRLPDENQMMGLAGQVHRSRDGRRMRGSAYSDLRKRTVGDVAVMIRSYFHKEQLPLPSIPKGCRCQFRFDWHEADRRRDPDNVSSAGRKIILDTMRQLGILHNDGWSTYVEGRTAIYEAFHIPLVPSQAGVSVFVRWYQPGEAIKEG